MDEFAKLNHVLKLPAKEILAAAEALHILAFAELKEDEIRLTAAGRVFAEANTEERKAVFKKHLLNFVRLAGHIKRVLDERGGHSAPRQRFEMELEDHLSRAGSERTLRTIIGWARYAELFTYDDRLRKFAAVDPKEL